MVASRGACASKAPTLSYDGFSCCATGAVHLRNDTPMQDSVLFEKHDGFTIACACDGHGGGDYFRSSKGSEFACRAAALCLSSCEFIEAMRKAATKRREDELILQIKKSIIYSWNELVREDVSQNEFTPVELAPLAEDLRQCFACGEKAEIAYGTTLICAIATDEFLLALQIGDGLFLSMDESGEISSPMPKDERCFLNYTSSLCTQNALECARHYFTRTAPAAVFLSTDGVDKSFAGFEQLRDFYSLLYSSIEKNGIECAREELSDFLPRLSKNGSGDDVSVAVMYRNL